MANANPTLFDYAQQEVEYREIQGFPGYRVGDDGSVWTLRNGGRSRVFGTVWHRIKGWVREGGHIWVKFRFGGKRHTFQVHCLVLESFVGPRPKGLMGLHKDDNPTNNVPSNLYWGTKTDNAIDAIANRKAAIGSRHGNAKLTESQVVEIRHLADCGWKPGDLAAMHGVSKGTISLILTRKQWKHV